MSSHLFKNKLLLQALLWTSKGFEKPLFSPANLLARKTYRSLLPFFFTVTFPKEIKISLRHSTQSGQHFNVFLSDIDLSAFLEEASPVEISHVKSVVSKWKRILPSLGEIEIYTFAENQKKEKILAKHSTTIPYFHNLRKVRWMETALSESPSPYHAYKAERAIGICLRKISETLKAARADNLTSASSFIEQFLKKQFGHEMASASGAGLSPQTVESHFFATAIHCGKNEKSGMNLSVEAGFVLLSLIPGTRFFPESIQGILRDLRVKNPRLKELHVDLANYEMTMFRAFVRSQPQELQWMTDWLAGVTQDANGS